MTSRTTSVVTPSRPGFGALAVLLVAMAGSAAGGCSMSYQLGSLFGKDDDKPAAAAEKAEVTGAVKPSAVSAKPGDEAKITEADLAAASAAATSILASGAKNSASVPWESAKTGARGMITPLTSANTQDGTTCRDFLASIVRDETEAWVQGEACRGQSGRWIVRSLKPWKRA